RVAVLISKPITLGAREQEVFNHADLPVVKDELSITLRLKLQDYTSSCFMIFHKGTDDLIRTSGLWLSENKLHARFTGNWDNNEGIMRVDDELLLQKWYHIAYTLSDPEKRLDLYVNGEWVGYYSIQDVKKQRVIFNDGPLYIGQAFSRDGFNGEISNVRYFNWRLTPEEVKKDLSAGLRKNEDIFYIYFDDEGSDEENLGDENLMLKVLMMRVLIIKKLDKKVDDNSASILKLRSFKNNTKADIILINKATGKVINQENGTEITQVDLAEADNNCILWTLGSKQNDGTRSIHPNKNEHMSLDVRFFPTHGGSNQLWTFQQVLSD
ncbi:concanavalin A-like lectin/glucanase domain-containing protein, partial [Gigaspora rosea]